MSTKEVWVFVLGFFMFFQLFPSLWFFLVLDFSGRLGGPTGRLTRVVLDNGHYTVVITVVY